ncbi:hypothetical protein MKX01_042492 [Papaver californicum]|nr:hypothetical protein MKX01_042492 [Papaver californicum]
MIDAHVDHNSPKEALHLFSQMIMQVQIIPSVLRACIHTEDFGLGKQVHDLVFKLGHSEDIITCSSFIDFYAKFRCLDDSQRSLIMYYLLIVILFKKMSREGVKRNGFTISNVLRTCGRFSRGADDYEKNDDDRGLSGKQVHGACQHHQTWSGRI